MARASWLAATLPVQRLAMMSVDSVRAAAAAVGASGPLVAGPLDPERVAGAFSSDRLLRLAGRPVQAFASLSGFFEARDGWVRTHGNYPHHAQRLASLLGLAGGDRAEVAGAIAARSAAPLEEDAAAVGAIVVRVRGEEEWRRSPMGRASASTTPVVTRVRDDVAALAIRGGDRPLAGIRVLDLTRVLAGPVCTRTLALLGAEVLRIDPPIPAEITWQHLDTGQGKRSALLDLRIDTAAAQDLLDGAHVLVTGYRPGAIESFGLRPPPGLVRARVNAWGDEGPWAMRRGFDSAVQAASGIAWVESPDGVTPGALPAQALDHATGYLLAAGVVEALGARARDGRGRDVDAALARTASWLLREPGRTPHHPPPITPRTVVPHPDRTTAAPALPGVEDYPWPAHPWGSDTAGWSQ